MELIRPFANRLRDPASGALFASAVWTVDSLHYLDDVDRAYDASGVTIGDHRPDVVDVAHARWATGTCITALDLCAAGLGRAFCRVNTGRELSLGNFEPGGRPPKRKRQQLLHASLPPPAQQWVDDAWADPDYRLIKTARDSLTHSRLRRHFAMDTAGPPQRLELETETDRLSVRRLVLLARDVGTRHVSALLGLLPNL